MTIQIQPTSPSPDVSTLQLGRRPRANDPLSGTWPDDSDPSSRVYGVPAFVEEQPSGIEIVEPGLASDSLLAELDALDAENPLRQTVTRVTPRGHDEATPWRALGGQVRLSSGKRVPGTRYAIVRWIGEGGMGMVFEAVHVDLRRPVALKILKPTSADTESQRGRFLAEARAIAKVDSRFVVDVLDFGDLPDGRPFYAMELLRPSSLHTLLDEHGPLPLDRVLPILRQCCKALAAVHEQGMAHRDVKPENVLLLDEEGRADTVRLVDFGIAAPFCSRPKVAGTLMYMAPEQIRDAEFDGRLDVYALGCVAFEMLTGVPPFEGATPMAVANGHLENPIPKPSERRPELPEVVDEIIARCLAKRPSDRYASMAELEAALCEVQIATGISTPWDDLPLPAVDEETRERLHLCMPRPRTSRRRFGPRLWLATGAFVVGVFSVLLGFASDAQQSPQTVTVTAAATDVDQLVTQAREAASRASWTYPVGDVEQATALATIRDLERGFGPLHPMASLYAMQLRTEFADTLEQLGDRYWDQPHGRPFAAEFYAQSLMFDDDRARARDRVGLTTAQLAQLSTRALDKDYFEVDLEIAGILKVLSEPNPATRRRQVVDLLTCKDERPSSLHTATELAQLVGTQDPGPSREGVRTHDHEGNSRSTAPREDSPRKARQATPEYASATHQVRDIVHRANRALDEGRRDRARGLFTRALGLDPDNATAHAGLARVHFADGHYAQAMYAARRAVAGSPRDAELQLLLGDASLKSARYDAARHAYTRAGRLGHNKAGDRLDELERLMR